MSITSEEYQTAKADLEEIVNNLHTATDVTDVLDRWRRGKELQKTCQKYMDEVLEEFKKEEAL